MQQATDPETPPRSPGFVAAEDMAEGARTMLGIADALMAAGHPVDLDGFEAEVAQLCASILALPRPEGHALAPQLIALCEQVERLQASMPPP